MKKNPRSIFQLCLTTLALFLSQISFYISTSFNCANASELKSKPVQNNHVGIDSIEINSASNNRLSLKECFKEADENNLDIKIASCDISFAQAARVISSAIPNPHIGITYGWGPAFQYIVGGNNQELEINQDIEIAGKRSKRISVAESDLLRTAFQLEAVRFEVHNNVRRTYIKLDKAQAKSKFLKLHRTISRNLLDTLNFIKSKNKITEAELLQIKLVIAQLDIEESKVSKDIVQNSADLAQLLGRYPDPIKNFVVEENDLFEFDESKGLYSEFSNLPLLDQLLPLAWKENKNYKVALQQAHVLNKKVTLTKSQRFPNPNLGFAYLYSTFKPVQAQYFNPNSSILTQAQQIQQIQQNQQNQFNSTGANTNSSNSGNVQAIDPNAIFPGKTPFQPGYVITASIETPVFSQYKGQVEQAKALWQEQKRQNEDTNAGIATDIVSTYEALLSSRKNIIQYQKYLLPNAFELMSVSKSEFDVDKVDLTAYIMSIQNYLKVKLEYLNCVEEYETLWADLEKSVGVHLR